MEELIKDLPIGTLMYKKVEGTPSAFLLKEKNTVAKKITKKSEITYKAKPILLTTNNVTLEVVFIVIKIDDLIYKCNYYPNDPFEADILRYFKNSLTWDLYIYGEDSNDSLLHFRLDKDKIGFGSYGKISPTNNPSSYEVLKLKSHVDKNFNVENIEKLVFSDRFSSYTRFSID